MGKIQLLKTYELLKLNYVSSLKVVPQWLITEVEKINVRFFFLVQVVCKERNV